MTFEALDNALNTFKSMQALGQEAFLYTSIFPIMNKHLNKIKGVICKPHKPRLTFFQLN